MGCGHRLGEGSRSARTGLLRRAALALWPAHGIRRCRCRTNSRARRGAAVVGVVARSRDVAGAQHLCLMRRAPRGCLPPVLGVLAGGFGPSLPDRTLLDEVSVIYVLHRDRRHIKPLGGPPWKLSQASSTDGSRGEKRGDQDRARKMPAGRLAHTSLVRIWLDIFNCTRLAEGWIDVSAVPGLAHHEGRLGRTTARRTIANAAISILTWRSSVYSQCYPVLY